MSSFGATLPVRIDRFMAARYQLVERAHPKSTYQVSPLTLTVFTSKRLLGRCKPDFLNLAEFHMLPDLQGIVVGLHGKPTFR